jgi:hypothetical protein
MVWAPSFSDPRIREPEVIFIRWSSEGREEGGSVVIQMLQALLFLPAFGRFS